MKQYHPYRGNSPQKKKKPWLTALLALVLVGILAFAAVLGQVLIGARDDVHGDPKVMIILGRQLHDWGPSVLLQDRLDTALDYLDSHPDMTVVVSGGQGDNEPTSEAQGMSDYLTGHGFPSEQIILETYSHNTHQNMIYSAQHLRDAGIDLTGGVLIVSNGFHLTRSRMLAGRAGFTDVSTLAAPSSHTATRLWMYVREPLALVKSFLFDR